MNSLLKELDVDCELFNKLMTRSFNRHIKVDAYAVGEEKQVPKEVIAEATAHLFSVYSTGVVDALQNLMIVMHQAAEKRASLN